MKYNGITARGALLAVLIAFAAISAGCNTVQGVGRDIEAAGEKTQEAAQAVRKKL